MFLSHSYGMAGHLSGWHQLFPLNDFFSRNTRPISTKLGWKHAWEVGIQICSNKGAGPF